MVSAIVMAGYNNKREVKKYSKMVAEHYGEELTETGYKPLREFQITTDEGVISKPIIQFTLETLSSSELVDEIIIVGHQMLLEQRLGNVLKDLGKPCRIVNQNARLPQPAIDRLEIGPKKIKYNSMAGNMIKGYVASAAFRTEKHALFAVSDSPLTPVEFIEQFVHTAGDSPDRANIFLPAILIEGEEDRLGRKPLKLRNDSRYPLSGFTDSYGRQGFRLSSLAYANLFHIHLDAINIAYSLRKCLSPNVQLRLFRTTRNLGYSNVYSKYFIRKDLSITEIDNIMSKLINGRFSLIPMKGEETTYDYDGTDEEYRQLTAMLNKADRQEIRDNTDR